MECSHAGHRTSFLAHDVVIGVPLLARLEIELEGAHVQYVGWCPVAFGLADPLSHSLRSGYSAAGPHRFVARQVRSTGRASSALEGKRLPASHFGARSGSQIDDNEGDPGYDCRG